MDGHGDAAQMSARLAAIRENLSRMRDESRESLRRLAATREAADVNQAARDTEHRVFGEPGAPI
jgi:hypothetical protein